MCGAVGQRIGLTVRKKLYGNILDQDMEFFDVNKTGELANRLSTDVHEVAEHLVENVSGLLTSSVSQTAGTGALTPAPAR
jgi:ABC-type multidrug transport system fused ATPase/permease subunit